MELSESLKIIEKLELLFPSFKPEYDAKELWQEELRESLAGYTCEALWPIIKTVLREECCKFAPTPYELCGMIRYRIANEVRNARHDQQRIEAPKEERISQEEAAANIAKLKGIVKSAKMANPDTDEAAPEVLKKAVGKSCDDLELDTIAKGSGER